MLPVIYLALLLALAFALQKYLKSSEGLKKSSAKKFSSLPIHYVYCFVLWAIIVLTALVIAIKNQLIATAAVILALLALSALTIFLYRKRFPARTANEKFFACLLFLAASSSILITIAITCAILFNAIEFFKIVNVGDFLFGTIWNPQVAIYADQAVATSSFGMIPVLLGTLMITLIAILVAAPIGLMSAIYLSFYAKGRDWLKPMIEILAGIPTVVYGYFAVFAVAPFLKNVFGLVSIDLSAESALVAGLVMGVMIIPFVTSLSDDALSAVPVALKDSALALGSTKSEMIRKVALQQASPNLISAIILATSRAIGETMIVVMAAGLIAQLTFNPLHSTTTATVQIVTLLTGDQEFDSPKTLAAFALALVLFCLTLMLNFIAIWAMKRKAR